MSPTTSIRTVRFHAFGEPLDVLRLEQTEAPTPAAGRIGAIVHACGVNPADWALCRGLFPGNLPRGIGLEVAGIVDAVGEGVTDIEVGDRVFGTPDWIGAPVGGASDRCIMEHWATLPAAVDFVNAAALPMAITTAYIHLDALAPAAGQTLLIHGAGTSMGYAAVQMGLMRGAKVIATAGETYAERLRALGAKVTSYGEGMVERVRELAGHVDLVLDTAPPNGVLPDLVKIADGDPKRVMTITDFEPAQKLGVRYTFGEKGLTHRYDILGQFAQLAAEGKFTVPVAKTFPLADWKEAYEISVSGKARGKLVLVPIT